ncbi:hypothetical protein L1080_023370 [Rhodococcus sp. MSC1_016]|jgi:hypothetical protein|uniref:hypothetical protein n=1 Tax=Rhodococcus sp. MSC1_016 TaxID=2909266 RepID=UPI00202ED7E0|nr:hypothetical protein [Rhodococcus sp. MSC1_016]
MNILTYTSVFAGTVVLGKRSDGRSVQVSVTESGRIEVTFPQADHLDGGDNVAGQHHLGDANKMTLTFDEAEHLAQLLNDSALIVRVSHGAGFEVA